MNILYVCNDMEMGGSPIGIITEIEKLKERGHNLYVISKGGPLEIRLNDIGIEHIKTEMPIYPNINKPKNKVDIVKNDCLNLLRGLRKMRYMKSINTIKNVIRDKEIDIIQVCQPGPTQVVSIAAKERKVPYIIRVQHVLMNEFPPINYKKIEVEAKGFSVITKEIRDHLEEIFQIKNENINIIPTGVELYNFKDIKRNNDINTPDDVGLKLDSQVILNVSTHGYSKCMPVFNLIKSMEIIGRNYTNLICILVGDGSEHEKIKAEAKRVNDLLGREAIFVLGKKNDIRPYLKISNIILGVGRVAMEGLASGNVLICSSQQGFGGIFNKNMADDIASYNFSGRNTNYKSDVQNISDSIESYMNLEDTEKKKLSDFGQKYVLENYDLDKIIDKTEHLLIKNI